MKYNVHLYPVFKVLVENVEAASLTEAIDKAEETDWAFAPMDYTEGHHCFLVDVVGDTDYSKSQWYLPDGETPDPMVDEIGIIREFLALYKKHPARGSDWANFHRRVKQQLGVKDEG